MHQYLEVLLMDQIDSNIKECVCDGLLDLDPYFSSYGSNEWAQN